jgi:hypothetical protein
MYRKLLGIIRVEFDARGQLLIIYSAFLKYVRKTGNTISYLQNSRRPQIHLGGRYFIIISLSFDIPMKLVRLI